MMFLSTFWICSWKWTWKLRLYANVNLLNQQSETNKKLRKQKKNCIPRKIRCVGETPKSLDGAKSCSGNRSGGNKVIISQTHQADRDLLSKKEILITATEYPNGEISLDRNISENKGFFRSKTVKPVTQQGKRWIQRKFASAQTTFKICKVGK